MTRQELIDQAAGYFLVKDQVSRNIREGRQTQHRKPIRLADGQYHHLVEFALPILALVACLSACKPEDITPLETVALSRAIVESGDAAAIDDWRQREYGGIDQTFNASGYFDDIEARRGYVAALRQIAYDSDKAARKDRTLQTSAETMSRGAGICGDRAIWLYMRLRMQNFDDSMLAIVVFYPPITGPGHTALCKLEVPDDLNSFRVIDDNRLRDVGECPPGMQPMLGFNLWETWGY